MPFKSDAQRRFMFAAQERGELPKGTAERWAKHTPNIKNLPEKAKRKKTASEIANRVLVKVGYSLIPDQYDLLSPTAQHFHTGGQIGGLVGMPLGVGLGLAHIPVKSKILQALLGLAAGNTAGRIVGSGIGAGLGSWKERHPEYPGQ